MDGHSIIRQVIEELYGPCPVEDFEHANQWAEGVDWERVEAVVAEQHPEFPWVDVQGKSTVPAEAMILHVRSEMLEEAGRRSLE